MDLGRFRFRILLRERSVGKALQAGEESLFFGVPERYGNNFGRGLSCGFRALQLGLQPLPGA